MVVSGRTPDCFSREADWDRSLEEVSLALRSFDQAEARLLAGTEGAGNAFWSPDSRFLGFFAAGKLQKIDVSGGPPQVICDAPLGAFGGVTAGGTWSTDGTIVFGVGTAGAGLFRVSSGGGTPLRVTTPDAAKNESAHRHPWFLPDGRRFLFVAAATQASAFSTNEGQPPRHSVYVGSLDRDLKTFLLEADAKAVLRTDLFYSCGTHASSAALRCSPLDDDG